MGAVLVQKFDGVEHPIVYWSSQLNDAQRNYSVSELECAAVLAAVKHFDYLLLDKPFKIITDHSALQWLPSKNSDNKRLARAATNLSQFNFTIEYRRGTQNAAADALSRNPPRTQQTVLLIRRGHHAAQLVQPLSLTFGPHAR
jgi:hypothetical protein